MISKYFSSGYCFQETFLREQREQYKAGTVKVPLSHNGVARTDRIYLSEEMLEDFTTTTCYIGKSTQSHLNSEVPFIDNSGSNDHCIVEINPSPAGKNSDIIISTELSAQVNRGEVSNVATVDHSSRWEGIMMPSLV